MGKNNETADSILLVDDDPDNISVLSAWLRKAGYAVLAASDPGAAIELAQSRNPALVFIDSSRPGIDANGICRRIHARPSLERIPVIFARAASENGEMLKACLPDFADYIAKPVKSAELLGRVRNQIERRRYESSLEAEKERYRILTESVGEAFLMFDAAFARIEYASPAFARIFGIAPPPLPAGIARLYRLVHPADLAALKSALAVVRKKGGGNGLNAEFRVLRPNGTLCWVWARSSSSAGKEEKDEKSIVCVIEDITDRKVAEMKLREAFEAEAELAGTIQQSLLMNEEKISSPGMDATLVSLPSKNIDGDFFDVFSFDAGVFDVVVGDVMGKGIHAALIGAGAKMRFLRAQAKLAASSGGPPPPDRVVEEVNRAMSPQLISLDSFFTVQYLRFDRGNAWLEYVDCGHTPIVIWDGSACWAYKGMNLPIGFVADQEFSVHRVPLRAGSIVLVYSDGVTEAAGADGVLFGELRLIDSLRRNSSLSSTQLVDAIRVEVEEFSMGHPLTDDLTLAAFRVCEDPPAAPSLSMTDRTMRADLGCLEEVRKATREMLSIYPPDLVDERSRDLAVLAASEAASNVVIHGINKEAGEDFRLVLEARADWYSISFIHRGPDFDWAFERQPSTLAFDESGYGLFIMRQAMHSVVFARNDQGFSETILSAKVGMRRDGGDCAS